MKEIADINIFCRFFLRSIKEFKSNFLFFIGSEFFVGSGVPGLKELTLSLLEQMKALMGGDEYNFNQWLNKDLPEYRDSKAAMFFRQVLDSLYLIEYEKREFINSLLAEKTPSEGCKIFARLVNDEHLGPYCSTIFTNIYENLLVQALGNGTLKTQGKKTTLINIAGDLYNDHLDENFEENMVNAFKQYFRDVGIIFMGYEGIDKSVINILNRLPNEFFRRGIYWVSPEPPLREDMHIWLQNNGGIWVKTNNYEELMLCLEKEIFESKDPLVTLEEIMKMESRDPIKANQLYQELISRKNKDPLPCCCYARFLARHYNDYCQASYYYELALQRDQDDPEIHISYANFLAMLPVNNRDKAIHHFKRALEIDRENANAYSCYGGYLLAQGFVKEGFEELSKGAGLPQGSTLELEYWFYKYAQSDENSKVALDNLTYYIKLGIVSQSVYIKLNMEQALKRNHHNPTLLLGIYKKITNDNKYQPV